MAMDSTPADGEISDYGSEIDDRELSDLLSTTESQPIDNLSLTSIEQDPITEHAIIHLRSSGQSLHESGYRESEIEIPVTFATNIEHSSVSQYHCKYWCSSYVVSEADLLTSD